LDSKIVTNNSKLCKPKRGFLKSDMESLINHFMLFSQGYPVSLNESYRVVEAPKGEFAIGLSSDNSAKPSRCSIKAPGFLHIQGLSFMSEGFLISDLVTIIGTLDLVFGEIDR
jgi:NADH-quinone oxidoreductase subunit D